MRGVENTVFLFFNDVFNIPVLNQMITAHKEIYNLFGFGKYQKPHSVIKSKSYEFHNRKIYLFSVNDTRMYGYFIEIHRDLRMRKALPSTFSSSEFNNMSLNSKLYKLVSYIQDNKVWERIYRLLKIIFTCLRFLCIADINKPGM